MIALLALLGWLFQIEMLVKLRPDSAVIQVPSAVSLLSIAVALACHGLGWRRVSYFAVLPALFIASVSALAYLQGGPSWLDTLLGEPFVSDDYSPAGRSSVSTLTCVYLLGFGVLLLAGGKPQSLRPLLGATLAAATLGLCGILLSAAIVRLTGGSYWVSFSGVSLQTALGLSSLAATELIIAWRQAARAGSGYPRGLAIPIVVAVIAMTAATSRSIHDQEAASASAYAELEAAQSGEALTAQLESSSDTLARVARLMAEQQEITASEWDHTADNYFRDLPGLVSLDIESNGRLHRANANRLGETETKRAWSLAFAAEQPASERRMGTLDGPAGHVYFASTASGATGSVVRVLGVFALEPVVQATLSTRTRADFGVRLTSGEGEVLFETEVDEPSDLNLEFPVHEQLPGLVLVLTASDRRVQASGNALPATALGAGIVLAILLGLSAHLAVQGRYRAQSLGIANTQLADGKERVTNLVNSLLDGVMLLDNSGTIEEVNPAACGMFRADAQALEGRQLEELLSDSSPAFSQVIARLKTSKMDELLGGNREIIARRPDASEFPASIAVTHFHTSEGRKYAWIMRDVSREHELAAEREKLIRELNKQVRANRELASRYSALYGCGGVGLGALKPDGRFIEANEALAEMVGYTIDELMTMSIQQLNHPADRAPAAHFIEEMKTGEREAYNVMKRYVHKDGSSLWVDVTGAALRDDDGELIAIIGICLDVTARIETARSLEASEKQLRIVNKELESLVYVASHDLRSPLVNLQGFSKQLSTSIDRLKALLNEDVLPAELGPEILPLLNERIPEAISFIGASTLKMDRLIKGLLRLSRLGRVALHPRDLDMNTLIDEVVRASQFVITERGVNLEIGELPACHADEDQMHQVFSNLLDNAIKYLAPDRPGEISIHGERRGAFVEYTVSDNGIGIAGNHREIIFEIFHRLKPNDRTGGEGLGLSVVRRLLERNNGSVRVESTAGQGSSFFVTLPAVTGAQDDVNTLKGVHHDATTG